MGWHVYILRCADDTLYTGITTDLDRRLAEHNAGQPLGARYTHVRRPVQLAYHEPAENRTQASQREHALKKLDRASKLALIRRQIRGQSSDANRTDPHA